MHFMLSIHVGEPRCPAGPILESMAEALAAVRHQQVFPGTYVVQVAGYGRYEGVQRALLERARQFPDARVGFLMSPLIDRGLYHGRMEAAAAESINQLTD